MPYPLPLGRRCSISVYRLRNLRLREGGNRQRFRRHRRQAKQHQAKQRDYRLAAETGHHAGMSYWTSFQLRESTALAAIGLNLETLEEKVRDDRRYCFVGLSQDFAFQAAMYPDCRRLTMADRPSRSIALLLLQETAETKVLLLQYRLPPPLLPLLHLRTIAERLVQQHRPALRRLLDPRKSGIEDTRNQDGAEPAEV